MQTRRVVLVLMLALVGCKRGDAKARLEEERAKASVQAAGMLQRAVVELRKQLLEIDVALAAAADRTHGRPDPLDPELASQLRAVKLEVAPSALAAVAYLSDSTIGVGVVRLFAEAGALEDAVGRFVMGAKGLAIPKPGAAAYGVLVTSEPETTAEVVELGAAVCADGKPHPDGCGAPPAALLVRGSSAGPWTKRPLAGPDQLVGAVILLKGNDVAAALTGGAEATLGAKWAGRELVELARRTQKLLEDSSAAAQRLERMARPAQ